MNLKELRERRAKLMAQVEDLTQIEEPTEDQSDSIEAMVAEIESIDEQMAVAEERAKAEAKREARVAALRAKGERQTEQEPAPEPVSQAIRGVRERVQDDPKRGFKSMADFALEVFNAGPSTHAIFSNPRFKAAAGDGMSQGITADGGVLIPPAFRKDVWDGARQMSESMLQYCEVDTIDPGVQYVERPAINETSRATGSRWGGIRGYWKSELTQMTESKPSFKNIRLEPHELFVFAYVSDKLLRNAPGMASGILTRAAADEINWLIGNAIVNGDGVGKPKGFIGHSSVVSVAKESGQPAATVVSQNINKMYARCHANWRSGAVWFVNQDVEPALQTLSLDVGTGGVPLYVPPGGISEAPYARLKGLPVVPIEYCKTLGTVGDIVLANLKSYAVGIRGMVDQSESMHLKFDYAQTAFRFIFEVDGQPYMDSPITPANGTNTLSPIVTLATRA